MSDKITIPLPEGTYGIIANKYLFLDVDSKGCIIKGVDIKPNDLNQIAWNITDAKVIELNGEKLGFSGDNRYYAREYTWYDDEIIIVMEIEIRQKVLKILSCTFSIDTKKIIEKMRK